MPTPTKRRKLTIEERKAQRLANAKRREADEAEKLKAANDAQPPPPAPPTTWREALDPVTAKHNSEHLEMIDRQLAESSRAFSYCKANRLFKSGADVNNALDYLNLGHLKR